MDGARAFVDATPAFAGWDKVDAYEIVTPEGKLLSKRAYASHDRKWSDA